MKISIADDHTVVRLGLRKNLEEEFPGANVGEASSAQEVTRLVGKQEWDMVIMDTSMRGRTCLDLLKEVKTLRPELPVLFLNSQTEDPYAMRLLASGADGYLSKDVPAQDLLDAVHKLLAGGRYGSGPLAEKLAASPAEGILKPLHQTLSNREFEVLRMIASGRTVTQIAKDLALSIKTVSTYRTRLLEKMGMKTNAELMRYALQNRLVE